MNNRVLAAAPLAALLATTIALAPAASASPIPAAPPANRPAAGATTWLYTMEADWVRMHTRPSTRSTTKALARLYDYSPILPQQAPHSGGFTLFTDRKNGVTGWVLSSYLHEQICLNGYCQ